MAEKEKIITNNMTGIACLVSVVAALIFSAITCLGLGFYIDGPAITTALSVTGFLVITSCVVVMCRSAVARNRRKELPRELAASAVLACVLALCSVPFFKFTYIFEHRNEIKSDIRQMYKCMSDIDKDYAQYVDNRMVDLQEYAEKKHSPDARMVERSLRRRLMPVNYTELCNSHKEWLTVATNLSVFNISTPHNMRILMEASCTWSSQYTTLSSLSYNVEKSAKSGYGYAPFSHRSSSGLSSKWIHYFSDINAPSLASMPVYLILIALILALYISVLRPRNRITGTHK